MESFNLDQYINFPTRIHGHALDLMTFAKECAVPAVSISEMISGHFSAVVDLQIPINHSRTVPQTKLNAINTVVFMDDIENSELIIYPKNGATELAI